MLAAAQQRRAAGSVSRGAGAKTAAAAPGVPRRALAAAGAAAATAGPRRQSRRCVVFVRAHASMATGLKMTGFVGQMRQVAMKLHTREQAPKEGGTEAPKQAPWVPSRVGYARFLAESKVVFGAFESIMAAADGHPEYAKFRNTGLERTAALTQDLAFMASDYGVVPPEPKPDGPGHTYAALLASLSKDVAPAFICHYYNFYFAHTAGGRMIGAKVSQDILGGKDLAFYSYGEGQDVAPLLDAVRASINGLAEGWDDAQKARCLEETAASFKWSGQLLRLITETE